MTLLTKCPVCRKKKLFIKKWRYSHTSLPSGSLTSDNEVCWRCSRNAQALVLGKWSIRHYFIFSNKLYALMKKHGKLEGSFRETLDNQVPPTLIGWITKLTLQALYLTI